VIASSSDHERPDVSSRLVTSVATSSGPIEDKQEQTFMEKGGRHRAIIVGRSHVGDLDPVVAAPG